MQLSLVVPLTVSHAIPSLLFPLYSQGHSIVHADGGKVWMSQDTVALQIFGSPHFTYHTTTMAVFAVCSVLQ